MKRKIIVKAVALTIGSLVLVHASYAESVRVVSEFGQEPAAMNIVENAESETKINLTVSEVTITSAYTNDTPYKKINLPETEHLFTGELADNGRPSIPIVSTFLAIPDQAGIQVSVDYSDYDILEDIDLLPVQPSTPESGPGDLPFTIDEQIYATDAFYPGELAEAGDPVILRDIRMVQISMYPVQYNPVRKQLKIYRDLSVSISYSGEDAANTKNIRRPFLSDGFYPLYRALLANFDQFYSTLEVRRGGYLILAKDAFVDSLKGLADWKHRKGYSVHIAPTTEIDPDGNPSQFHVYDYIQNAYETWEIPPEYVIIVGDEDNIGYTGIPDYPYNYYSSDHPYSMVEGDDYMPDIFVGRLSVDNMPELRVAVAKILAYERSPQMEDIDQWRRGLSIGGNVYAYTPRLTVLWVRQLLLQNGFTHVDTSFRWNSGQSDPYLLGYFDDGPCIVSYRGWAGASGWYCPAFNTSNLGQIQNHNRLAVVASVVCGTGDFGAYTDPCFGEKWIRMGSLTNGLKGGPAFLGSTDASGHTRWHNPIMVGYYWGMFNEGIYHFAAAAVRGKIKLYRTFPSHSGPGETVEKYFHTFNILGDPELEIRTEIPLYLTVSHPQSIPLGINYAEINVTGNNDAPVEGAFVTLIKSDGDLEEVFEVGKTDGNGFVPFQFDAQSSGDMSVTVSGRNLYPYEGSVMIAGEEIAVGFDSLFIDDDNFGNSSGNGDGIANPAETVELEVALRNFGNNQIAINVNAALESLDIGLVNVYDAVRYYGDISPGEIGVSENPFIIRISPGARYDDLARLKVIVSDEFNNTWESMIEIPVEAPRLFVSEVSFPDGGDRLDPGETAQMILTLTNAGSIDARGVAGRVSTGDDYTKIISSDGFFGDIPAGESGDNSNYAFIVSADSAAYRGRNVNLVLHATTQDGIESDVPFGLVVGEIQTTDPAGPDDYGYYMYDDTDIEYEPCPAYEWIEISPQNGGPGQRIEFDNYDDDSQMITLPFDLVYYGDAYRDIIISIDGFIAPDTTRYDMDGNYWSMFFNWSIPDPGNAKAQISAFWDDISYIGSVYGVYTWYDSNNNRFIIEWYNMDHRNTDAIETFEMIILDPEHYPTLTGDSDILYQYHTILNDDYNENYASVGFESYDELSGLEYTFDNRYHPAAAALAPGRAIRVSTNTGRGGIRGNIDLSNNGYNQNARVSTSSGQYRITPQSGDYWIRNVPPGENQVDVYADGCFPADIDVSIIANITNDNVDFDMARCPIPSALTASEGLGNRIELVWDPVDHQDLTGYNAFRSRWENGEYETLNTMPISDNSFTDYAVPGNDTYWYYVTAVFETEDWTAESLSSLKDPGSLENPTGTGDHPALIPEQYSILQNYPNPFNNITIISFGLPHNVPVVIDIYDILGRKVETLVDERQPAGYHQVMWDAEGVSSGIYFYRIQAGEYAETKKMVLLK